MTAMTMGSPWHASSLALEARITRAQRKYSTAAPCQRLLVVLLVAVIATFGLAPVAVAAVGGEVNSDPQVTGASPSAKHVDGLIGDWDGESPMIGGQMVVSRGEFIYQDYIHDDTGAKVRADSTCCRSFRGNALPVGTYTYPDNAKRYGTNAADLLEFRAALVGDRAFFLIRLNTLLEADTTAVGIAIGESGGHADAAVEWPFGAGLSTPGTENVITLWGTGGAFGETPLEQVGGVVAVSIEDNAIEASLPLELVGESFRAYVATGLWDSEAHAWMPVEQKNRTTATAGGGDGQHPNIFNVAFRDDEFAANLRLWWEAAQAEALGSGDISKYAADINLRAADTPDHIVTGWHQRIYRSESTVPPGEGIDEAGVPNPPLGFLHFLGEWQPYSVYVPESFDRMTVLLHGAGLPQFTMQGTRLHQHLGEERGSLLIEPLARGIHNWYQNESQLAVLEAMNDAQAHYAIDPLLTTVGGLSMGGYGTARFLTTKPDLFGGGVMWSACFDQPSICNTREANPISMADNTRNHEIMINHGVLDPFATYASIMPFAGRLDDLGHPYEMLSHQSWEHTSVMRADDFRREAEFLQRQHVKENPAEVTFKTSESSWAPHLSPDLVFDRAYWVSGISLRDNGQGLWGAVDAVTHGRGGHELHTAPFGPTFHPDGPTTHWINVPYPSPYTRHGRAETGAGPLINEANRFSATLENLDAVAFDVDRMGLSVDTPLDFVITTDGAVNVRLVGVGPGAYIVASEFSRDGDDLIVNISGAGTYDLRVEDSAQ